MGGGDHCTHTFFRRLFIHEKGGLEFPNFVTFLNSFELLGWSRRCRQNQPPTHATSRSPPLLGLRLPRQLQQSSHHLQQFSFFRCTMLLLHLQLRLWFQTQSYPFQRNWQASACSWRCEGRGQPRIIWVSLFVKEIPYQRRRQIKPLEAYTLPYTLLLVMH